MVLSLSFHSFSKSSTPARAKPTPEKTSSPSLPSLSSSTALPSSTSAIAGPGTETPISVASTSTSRPNPSAITDVLCSRNTFAFASRSKTVTDGGSNPTSDLEAKRVERKELNDTLAALSELFPDVKVEVFRELLVRFDGKSRLHVCVEQLLRYRSEWVKGRWNVTPAVTSTLAPACAERDSDDRIIRVNCIPEEELFRSDDYKTAVKAALSLEFRVLSRSVVDAVLAEVNFSYTRARPTLRDLSRKSWRVTFGNMLAFRRKKGDDHPLLVWQRGVEGELTPHLKETGCAELDRELHDTLLAPLLAQRKEEQE